MVSNFIVVFYFPYLVVDIHMAKVIIVGKCDPL